MHPHIKKIHTAYTRLLTVIHDIFLVSITLKAINGILELIAGVGILIVGHERVLWVASKLASTELVEDPHDNFATWLLHWSSSFTAHAQTVAALYLLSHGLIKLFIVYNVLRGHKWAYPLAIVVFSAFTIYQFNLFLHVHSWTMGIFTTLDIVVVIFTVLEWRVVHRPVEQKIEK